MWLIRFFLDLFKSFLFVFFLSLSLKKIVYIFIIWLHHALVTARGIEFPDQTEPNPNTALGGCSLSHWTTREVPKPVFLKLGLPYLTSQQVDYLFFKIRNAFLRANVSLKMDSVLEK